MLTIACCILLLSALAADTESHPLDAVIHGPGRMVAGHMAILMPVRAICAAVRLPIRGTGMTTRNRSVRRPKPFVPTEPGMYTIRPDHQIR